MTILSRSDASKNKELSALRRKAELRINVMVGEIRGLYITTTPGQDMIYSAKEAEAIAFVSMLSPPADMNEYPFIAGEVGITASTATGVAQVYLNLSHLWRGLAAQLEQVRLIYISQVDAAPDAASIASAVAGCNLTLGAYRNV